MGVSLALWRVANANGFLIGPGPHHINQAEVRGPRPPERQGATEGATGGHTGSGQRPRRQSTTRKKKTS